VHLALWYDGLTELPQDFALDRAFWEQVMAVKTAVNKELERLRAAKVIGGNLQAEVTLYCSPELMDLLAQLEEELRFVLITSSARLLPFANAPEDAVETELAGLKLKVEKSSYNKCARCWHHCADVGTHPEHPEICGRCITNLEGAGEVRRYA